VALESEISPAQAAYWKTATQFRVRSLGVTIEAAYQARPHIKIRHRLTRQIGIVSVKELSHQTDLNQAEDSSPRSVVRLVRIRNSRESTEREKRKEEL
jgi:hypothetical protein